MYHFKNNFKKQKNYLLHKDRIKFNETIVYFSSNRIKSLLLIKFVISRKIKNNFNKIQYQIQ